MTFALMVCGISCCCSMTTWEQVLVLEALSRFRILEESHKLSLTAEMFRCAPSQGSFTAPAQALGSASPCAACPPF